MMRHELKSYPKGDDYSEFSVQKRHMHRQIFLHEIPAMIYILQKEST